MIVIAIVCLSALALLASGAWLYKRSEQREWERIQRDAKLLRERSGERHGQSHQRNVG